MADDLPPAASVSPAARRVGSAALSFAPLAAFAGAVPPAPAWFTAALADRPDRSFVDVAGTAIEVLTWGEVGRPGLLLLHGNGAHAGWWDFIAPFFAAADGGNFRVAALSWSGMGRSGHRADYTMATFVAEIAAVVAAAGLDAAGPPIVVGHSFGGFPLMAAAAALDLKAAVVVDSPFRLPGEDFGAPPNATNRAHKIYPTLAAALARFRFAPLQPDANPFIVDHIARGALMQVAARSGVEVDGGWTWRFDPYLWSRMGLGDPLDLLAAPRCPVALIWGDRSALFSPARVAGIRALLPPGSPSFAIPDAAHHIMVDQPLAFVAALRGLFAAWPG